MPKLPIDHTHDFSSKNLPVHRVDPAVARQQPRPLTKVSQVARGSEEKNRLNPAFLWWTFRQWWKVIVPTGLVLAGIVAAGIIWTYEPDYKTSALVMVEDSAPFIAFSGSSVTGNTRKYVETQVELLRSSLVLGPVLARTEVAELDEFVNSVDNLKKLQKKRSSLPRGKIGIVPSFLHQQITSGCGKRC